MNQQLCFFSAVHISQWNFIDKIAGYMFVNDLSWEKLIA
jgi:hypothetical protein